ncbi:MAG TPA: peptidyl-alpha-hydroxyglycine alpha-amidating lyase family protein [Chloroflexota bacterium]|nr:peptidyl-alpha-hydroxyglycine alpha-amidating lyase family protein [Chloroflexota bacterium]
MSDAGEIKGPGGRIFNEIQNWAQLPAGWSFCDVPGVAVGQDDRVYVFCRGNCPRSADHPIIVLESDGTFVRSFGDGLFTMPHAIALGVDGLLYCVDVGAHNVRVFTPDGQPVRTIAGPVSPSDTGYTTDFRTIVRAAGPFNQPTKMVTAANGDLFASDGYGNARIHHFSPLGELQTSWGEPGDAHGAFNIPHSVLVLPDERVLVCDRENSRIQVFDFDGHYLAAWTDLARPDDVCVDDAGNVYVAELGERAALFPFMKQPYGQDRVARVSVLDLNGNVQMRWGDDPTHGLQFVAPHGITVDRHGNVYVGEVREAAGADRASWRQAVRKLARIG